MSQRADYSHTSDCSSLEIANPCLCIILSLIAATNASRWRRGITPEARASIRVDDSLRALARLWAILRLRDPCPRSQIRFSALGGISDGHRRPRLGPGL